MLRLPVLLAAATLAPSCGTSRGEPRLGDPPVVATFSIVACDPEAGQWGIVVQSRFLAVGSVVPWAEAGAGAVATQAWANTSFGPKGLALCREGLSAKEVVDKLVAADEDRDRRQLGVVDAKGRSAAWTGKRCLDWAGHRVGDGYCVQGNILAGEAVVDAMAKAFEEAEGELAERLVAALAAGQAAGGDRRGRQSAALYVVQEGAGYGGHNDRFRDLRVDDHERPIAELERLLRLHQRIVRTRRPASRPEGKR